MLCKQFAIIQGKENGVSSQLSTQRKNMLTEKLYSQDVYMKECQARVTEVVPFEGGHKIALDRTVFFPEGGGQPADRGVLLPADRTMSDEDGVIEIYDVHESEGIVYHYADENQHLPSPGDTVTCRLDYGWRFINMQRHLGEHILSGAFADLYGGVNRGFHMGDSYITVDIRLENDPAFDQITWEMCVEAEHAINDIIWKDLPVTVSHFTDPKQAAAMPLRKDLSDALAENDEEITIVTVGDMDKPADCVACCGTHPSGTAQVGLVKIYKVEKNKDMFRIYFDCGKYAMNDYDEKHRIITDISDRHSAGLEDLEKKMAAEEAKNSEVRAHMNTIVRSLAAVRAEDILTQAKEQPDQVIYRKYDDFTCDDILKIGKIIGPELKKPALILSEQEHTVMLFSDGSIHCGNLVRENANIYGGKGGGSDVQARAIFPDNKNIETFVDLIDKHLR